MKKKTSPPPIVPNMRVKFEATISIIVEVKSDFTNAEKVAREKLEEIIENLDHRCHSTRTEKIERI